MGIVTIRLDRLSEVVHELLDELLRTEERVVALRREIGEALRQYRLSEPSVSAAALERRSGVHRTEIWWIETGRPWTKPSSRRHRTREAADLLRALDELRRDAGVLGDPAGDRQSSVKVASTEASGEWAAEVSASSG